MAEIQYNYPLKLPNGWQVTPSNSKQYNQSFSRSLTLVEALRFLEDELNRLPWSAATVYSNYQHFKNERLRKQIGADPGVSLSFTCYDRPHFMACDRWITPEQNAYALHLGLRAAVQFKDWGLLPMDKALSLFSPDYYLAGAGAAGVGTPSSSMGGDMAIDPNSLPPWMVALGLGPTATLEDANATYRRRAKEMAGDEDALLILNQAIDEARKRL